MDVSTRSGYGFGRGDGAGRLPKWRRSRPAFGVGTGTTRYLLPPPDEDELEPDELDEEPSPAPEPLGPAPPDCPVVEPAAAPFLQSLDGLEVVRQSFAAIFFVLLAGLVVVLVEGVVSIGEDVVVSIDVDVEALGEVSFIAVFPGVVVVPVEVSSVVLLPLP